MNDLITRLSNSIEFGKINLASPYPPSMKGLPGADELCKEALDAGISPEQILNDALVTGMTKIGEKFSIGKAFIPEMLMSAKAMKASMQHLKPFFTSGALKNKGTLIIGTAAGDLHDIGKSIVAMMFEGAGWKVIDLGVDVKTDKFLETIEQYPDCSVGISTLLTTTMLNMERTVQSIKAKYPQKIILVGGAPLSLEFCNKIGADFYSPDPNGAIKYLNNNLN